MATAGASNDVRLWSKIQPWLWVAVLILLLVISLVSSPAVSAGTWHAFQAELFGWWIFAAGAAMRWWSSLYLSSGEPGTLVASGPYSVCRNPLSLANLLFGISLACFISSLTFLLGFTLVAISYFALRVPAEEKRLLAKFGEPYERYRRSVPRFWPRLRLFHSPEAIWVDVTGLAAELRRSAIWIWLPVVGKALSQLRAEIWWPHLFGLP